VDSESGKPMELAMQALQLQGKLLSVGARLMVRHVFRSGERKPLEVIYTFALPRDAALRQFVVAGESFRMRSKLKPTDEAVKEYEEGIQQGHLATLARQYGDGLVSLTLGNLLPGETVVVLLEVLAGVEAHDDGVRFRFPFTLAPSYHRQARAVEIEPGVGEIELPENEFGDLILPRYHKDATGLHEVGFSLSIAMGQPITEISSPSHSVRVKTGDGDNSHVMLSTGHDVPNRDLVLDVATRKSQSYVLSGMGKDQKTRFAAVVPSHAFGETSTAPRRVVFVLDRSGSMGGIAIEQARKALAACLGALAEDDEFGIIAFDDRVEEFGSGLHKGDKASRDAAQRFLDSVDARGGTELAAAVSAAVKVLGGTAGDVLIMTDGQVAGTENILSVARAGGVRLHCLGIGSASQDRFLTLLARETGGVCRFLTPRERIDLPAVELFASLGRPVASEVKARVECVASWSIAPDPASAIFAGTPLTLFGEMEAGMARLVIEWGKPQPGKLEVAMDSAHGGVGETLRLLQGSRLITDLDAKYTGDQSGRALDRREQQRVGDRLQALSEAYGLASRRMSLVAVVERAGETGELPKTVVVPVGMPQDVAMQAYFQRSVGAAHATGAFPAPLQPVMASPTSTTALSNPLHDLLSSSQSALTRASRVVLSAMRPKPAAVSPPREEKRAPEDALLDLARQLESDGGMPGKGDFERMVRSVVAVLAFLIEGHTSSTGAFRAHVQRLMRYLETSKFPALGAQHRDGLSATLAWIKQGKKPNWQLSELLAWKVDEAWKRTMQIVAGGA